MKKQLLYLVIIVFGQVGGRAQDKQLENSNQSLLNTNPSFAGSNGSLRNQTVCRSQSSNLSDNNISIYNGIDTYIEKLHGGLALSGMINSSFLGIYKSSELNLIYAEIFECKRGLKIIPSIQLSYLEKQADFSHLTLASALAYGIPHYMPSSKINALDASAGLLFNYKNFYAGGTVYHINRPDVGTFGTQRLAIRLNLNASYNMALNEKTLINFSSVFIMQAQSYTLQLSVNAILLKHLVVGLGYENNLEYLARNYTFLNLGYRGNYFSITAGYDISYGKLIEPATTGFQLALGLSLRRKQAGQAPLSFEKW